MSFDMNSLGPLLAGFQQKVEDIKANAGNLEAEGQAGGGAVKAVANAKMELVSLTIDPGAMDDREMLEDLVRVAANAALRAAADKLSEQVAELTGGLPLPPGMMNL